MTVADRRKLDATHDAVVRIEENIKGYNPTTCVSAGVWLRVTMAGLLLLWTVVVGILIHLGIIPNVKDPDPPTSIAAKAEPVTDPSAVALKSK